MLVRIRLAGLVALLVGTLTACEAPTITAPEAIFAVTGNERVTVSSQVFVPCANGGAGELVDVTYTLHLLDTNTNDAAGGNHGSYRFQWSGGEGIGLTTGDVYRVVGTEGEVRNLMPGGHNDTYVSNHRWISRGARLEVRVLWHFSNSNPSDVFHQVVSCTSRG